jgi:hypothetical protein
MPRGADADDRTTRRIKHRVGREALYRADPANFKRGSDGRVTQIKECTAKCERCTHEFTYRMTTRPRRFCVECYGIRQRERTRESKKSRALRRAAAPLPSKGLIPYVGYDPTEQPLEGEYHE